MDGEVRRIQSQLRRLERHRVRLNQERQDLLDEQSGLRHRPADHTPAAGFLGPLSPRTTPLERRCTRVEHELELVRRQEHELSWRLVQLGSPPSSYSSSRSTGSAPRVRQSALYSARRGPRGRQGRPVEEHTAEASSSEPGHTNTDLSQFEALTLNTTPPALESADRVEEHPAEVSSSEPGQTDTDLSQLEALALNTTPPTIESADSVVEPPTEVRSIELNVTSATETTDGAVVHAGDMDSRAPDSTNAKLPPVREGLSPRSQERWQRIDQYLAEHTFDDLWEGMVAMKNDFCDPPKKVPFPNKKSSKKLASSDTLQSPHGLDAQSSQATTQRGESTAQIIENGKQWMKKEVMEGFKEYMKETGMFRGAEFKLGKFLHQCLSVETYEKIFHHYNFTVKMKEAGSDKWSSTLYFAEVKEMYGRKHFYFYPLDRFEDGICHACKNQGMDALKHPAVPIGYEAGQADTGCPFFDDDSDDELRVPDDDGMAWAFSQVFFGGAPY